jgi:putative DNA primase/helicase
VINWNDYDAGNHRIKCPHCGDRKRDKTLGITIRADYSGVAHCHRCSFVETFKPERGANLSKPSRPRITPATPSEKHEVLSDWGHSLWATCKPLGGVALDYLNARRCVIPPADGHLRWHHALRHPSGFVGAGLVALITDVLTGEALSLHRTWIQANGTKADVDPPRLLLGGHRKQGGVIRLWPVEASTTTLGIAEGVETALSLAWADLPTWACIDAGNMSKLPVLPGIETLVIGRDNDRAGIDAAHECGSRWLAADREVLVTAQEQNDLNDLIMGATA